MKIIELINQQPSSKPITICLKDGETLFDHYVPQATAKLFKKQYKKSNGQEEAIFVAGSVMHALDKEVYESKEDGFGGLIIMVNSGETQAEKKKADAEFLEKYGMTREEYRKKHSGSAMSRLAIANALMSGIGGKQY